MRPSLLVVSSSLWLAAIVAAPVAHANPFKLKVQKSGGASLQGQQPPSSTTQPPENASSGNGSNTASVAGANTASSSSSAEGFPQGAFGPEVVGLRLGMTLAEVKAALGNRPGVNGPLHNVSSSPELSVNDPELGGLSLHFAKSSMRLRAIGRSHVPGLQFTPAGGKALETQLIQKYGQPSASVSVPGSTYYQSMTWFIDHQGRTIPINCQAVGVRPDCAHAITLSITLPGLNTAVSDRWFDQVEGEIHRAEAAAQNQQKLQQEQQNAANLKPKL